MFSDEKALFSKDTEIIQNMPLQHKEAWLDKVEKARLSCTFRNQSFMRSEREMMRNYLIRGTRPQSESNL